MIGTGPHPVAHASRAGSPSAEATTAYARPLEWIVFAHLAVLVIAAPWALGGNHEVARVALSVWGSLALPIALAHWNNRRAQRSFIGLLPWLVFNGVVFASMANPNHRALADGLGYVEAHGTHSVHLPSTASAGQSLNSLWFFDAAYLTAFNVLLGVRRRRLLRVIVGLVVINAALLAVFGTLQKLSGTAGIYFGSVVTRQTFVFASFLYHNHWGAFALLALAGAVGLAFFTANRTRGESRWNSPFPLLVVAGLFIAATLPLSGSRSATLLAVVLTLIVSGNVIRRAMRSRHSGRGTRTVSVVLRLSVLLTLAGIFSYYVAAPVIATRVATTRSQWDQAKSSERIHRAVLYRDTWQLASERLWFGWGMGCYPIAFFSRNSQSHSPIDGLPHYYEDAHSDWLQSVAEVGIAGTTLLVLCAVVPLWLARSRRWSTIACYLLLGCALIFAYAMLEFPFGNRAVVIVFWAAWFCTIQYQRLDMRADDRGMSAPTRRHLV